MRSIWCRFSQRLARRRWSEEVKLGLPVSLCFRRRKAPSFIFVVILAVFRRSSSSFVEIDFCLSPLYATASRRDGRKWAAFGTTGSGVNFRNPSLRISQWMSRANTRTDGGSVSGTWSEPPRHTETRIRWWKGRPACVVDVIGFNLISPDCTEFYGDATGFGSVSVGLVVSCWFLLGFAWFWNCVNSSQPPLPASCAHNYLTQVTGVCVSVCVCVCVCVGTGLQLENAITTGSLALLDSAVAMA